MAPDEPVTSMTMIEKAKSGDNDAWNRLIETYSQLVHAQCIRKGLQINDARDVTMEVFTSIFQSLGKFTKDRASDRFLHFLRSITSRRIVDHWRREAKREDKAAGGETDWLARYNIPESGELNEEHTQSVWNHEALVKSVADRVLEKASSKFQDRTMSVFKRVVVDGATVKDVALEFEMAETSVRTNVSRVKKWIQAEIGELPEDLRQFSIDDAGSHE